MGGCSFYQCIVSNFINLILISIFSNTHCTFSKNKNSDRFIELKEQRKTKLDDPAIVYNSIMEWWAKNSVPNPYNCKTNIRSVMNTTNTVDLFKS